MATRDPDRIGQFLDETVEWLLIGPVELFPYCGHHLGRSAVAEAYRRMARKLATVSYVPDYLLADGDCAAALTRTSVVRKEGGRDANLRLAHFARFRDGLVVEACTVMDSFGEQLLGRVLDVGGLARVVPAAAEPEDVEA